MCPFLSRTHLNTTVSFFNQRQDPLVVESGPLQPVTKGSRGRTPFLMLTSHSSCPGGSATRPQLAAKCTYPSRPVYPRGCSFNVASSSSGPSPAHPLGGSTGNIKDLLVSSYSGCTARITFSSSILFPGPAVPLFPAS